MILFSDYKAQEERKYKGSDHSLVWSISKKRWIDGPTYPKGYYAFNACAIALNRSAVLVAGLIATEEFSTPQSEYDFGLLPNTEALIYNFNFNSWIQQESIPIPSYQYRYLYDMTCSVIRGKNDLRFS